MIRFRPRLSQRLTLPGLANTLLGRLSREKLTALLLGLGLVPGLATGAAAAPRTGSAPTTAAAGPQQIASYPMQGDRLVPSDATLYIVFDQPTNKSGVFSVADLDSAGGVLLNLESPRWSAAGDTVFLKPVTPMTPGHLHGMRVNLVISADGTMASSDLPIIYFTVANVTEHVAIQSIFLEEPLPGTMIAAGDTIRARAVVTGGGTGAFRVIFELDGDPVATEEGYMESGRPSTVEPRGPIMTRRLGEHRLHVIVESPQNIAARPVTFLCVPPPAGVEVVPVRAQADTGIVSPPTPTPSKLTASATLLGVGKSKHRDEEAAGIAWSGLRARYAISQDAALEGNGLWRLRADDPENGSALPEQFLLRLALKQGSAEWGDLVPTVSVDAPLFASAVPRRGAQALWRKTPAGDLETFLALESRPRSAAGPIDAIRSDLYAARLTRGFLNDRVRASLYGGYSHDDPTSGAASPVTRADAVYGGSGRIRFAGDWNLGADLATVRHRTIEGVEPGRSRTGGRGLLEGEAAGFAVRAEAFRYQPDLATTLNPYALSNRKGGSADFSRGVAGWRFFGGFRREDPTDPSGVGGSRSDRWTVGGRLKLNDVSWVTPSLIRLHQKGAAIDLEESRIATELIIGEKFGGQTRARIDIAKFEDELGENRRRLVKSGSLVSTRRHPGRVTSTISGGIEINELQDLDLTDHTIQAAAEIRWEAIAGKLLVAPFGSWIDREYDTVARKEDRVAARLQVAWLDLPGMRSSALSLEARIDRINLQSPVDDKSVEGSVQLSFGQKIDLLK
jgi:hypothetical protein